MPGRKKGDPDSRDQSFAASHINQACLSLVVRTAAQTLASLEVRVEAESPTMGANGIGPERRTRYGLGLCGLLLAVVGLALAIARPYIADGLEPPPHRAPRPKVSHALAKAGEDFVDRMLEKARGGSAVVKVDPPPPARPPVWPWALYLSVAATSLGLFGSLSGTAGWIRREDSRMSVSAITVGALAVAWVYIMAALVIALVVVILLMLDGCSAGSFDRLRTMLPADVRLGPWLAQTLGRRWMPRRGKDDPEIRFTSGPGISRSQAKSGERSQEPLQGESEPSV